MIDVSNHLADILGLPYPCALTEDQAQIYVGLEADKGTVHIQNNDDGTRILRVSWFGSSGHATRAHWGSANGGGIGHWAPGF